MNAETLEIRRSLLARFAGELGMVGTEIMGIVDELGYLKVVMQARRSVADLGEPGEKARCWKVTLYAFGGVETMGHYFDPEAAARAFLDPEEEWCWAARLVEMHGG